jgi:hypothetical protein
MSGSVRAAMGAMQVLRVPIAGGGVLHCDALLGPEFGCGGECCGGGGTV